MLKVPLYLDFQKEGPKTYLPNNSVLNVEMFLQSSHLCFCPRLVKKQLFPALT